MQSPYRQSNQFLEGFIQWQHIGNPADWGSYSFQIFGKRKPTDEDIEQALENLGVEVVDFRDWPGYSNKDSEAFTDHAEKLIQIRSKYQMDRDPDSEYWTDPHWKADPEAEAVIIVKREREGQYYILSKPDQPSPSWFISHTSVLNLLSRAGGSDFIQDHHAPATRITWQPEAFLRFASTLSSGTQSPDRAFEILLWSCAQSGLSLLEDNTIETVFGGVIDQATLLTKEQRQLYEDTIEDKYHEPMEEVLLRVAPSERPLAAIQLANEMALVSEDRRQRAEVRAEQERQRATKAEKNLERLDKYRKRMESSRERGKRTTKKQRLRGENRRGKKK